MTLELPKITLLFFYLIIAAITMEGTHAISGFGWSESLKDPMSIVLALSFPLVLWGCIRLTPSNLPSFLSIGIYLTVFVVWGYFAYQTLTNTDYSIADMPGDIAYGYDWIMNNKKKVGLYVIAFALFTGFKRLGSSAGHVIGKEINSSIGSSENDQN